MTNMYDEIEYIFNLLERHRLKEALVQIYTIATQCSNWQLRTDVEALQTTYDLMLQYNAKGMKDPKQKDMYNKIFRSAYEMAERTYTMKKSTSSFALYYDLIRTYEHTKPHTLPELQMQLEAYTEDTATAPLIYSDANRREKELAGIRERHEKALNELFERTWTSLYWTEAEALEAQALLNSLLVPVNDLCVFISAITMNQSKIFDIRKFMLLLEAYNHPDPMVNQRAIVGIVITILFYEHRIMMYPEARAKLSLLNEDDDFIKNLHTVQIQLLLSRETQEIDRKMREEILPEMMKSPNIGNSNRIGLDEAEDSDDLNPEWEIWIDKSGISDKLREMGELQMEGADVYMSTFSQLKQFPFFRQMSHWFYPFDRQFPDIVSMFGNDEKKGVSLLDVILNSNTFCSSDKYSFCFSLIQMPEPQKKMMIHQMNEQSSVSQEQMEQITKLAKATVKKENISRQYIHDLYRFFKLWSRRSEEKDIFENSFELWNYNSLKKAITRPEELKKLADYFFQKNYMEEAFQLYSILLEENKANSELWQKAGYSLQKTGCYNEALDYYKQADIIAPDTLWTNRHLALCYQKLDMPEQALQYFKKIESVQPDNLNLSLQIGQCLVALKRYEEALGYFFKVEYLEKNPNNARRAIGWCSFVIGKYEEARKYYDLLLQAPKPKMQDWMNAGHLYYTLGNTETAIQYYQKARSMCEDSDSFLTFCLEDKEYLIEKGFSEEDIYILLDALL